MGNSMINHPLQGSLIDGNPHIYAIHAIGCRVDLVVSQAKYHNIRLCVKMGYPQLQPFMIIYDDLLGNMVINPGILWCFFQTTYISQTCLCYHVWKLIHRIVDIGMVITIFGEQTSINQKVQGTQGAKLYISVRILDGSIAE